MSTGNMVPAPTVLGLGGRCLPTENIDDDGAGNVETGGAFDPVNDAIDFYESLEGMMLQVNNGSVVGPTRSFGEITLLPDRGSWATGLRTRAGILLGGYTDPNPERITVDDEILRDLAPRSRAREGDARHERRRLAHLERRRPAGLQLLELQDPGDDDADVRFGRNRPRDDRRQATARS